MMKNIKKSVIAGALALAMVGTAVPVTANASTTTTKNGAYSSVSITRTASGSGTVTGYASATNKTASSRYMNVRVKSGTSYASSISHSYNAGVVASGSTIAATGYSIGQDKICYGENKIHQTSSSSSTVLETIHAAK